MVVAPHPPRIELVNLIKVTPILLGQPFVANRTVETLHIGFFGLLGWM